MRNFSRSGRVTEIERDEGDQEIRLAVDGMDEMVSMSSACAQCTDTLQSAGGNIVATIGRAIRITSVKKVFR
jgi:hypothetical protein